MVIMGRSLSENLLSDGGSTSSGKSFSIAFILRCASFKDSFSSASEVRVKLTVESPSKDFDSIFLTFSTEEMASSIFLVTEFSTSLEEAPGYGVEIVIKLRLNFGNNS